MRWGRFAFWSVLGLVALLALAVGWLFTADLGVFKPQLERWVSEKTGRDFAIDGALSVDLARHSVVVAEDLRLSNTDWAGTPQMLTVGRAEIRVDLWSLLEGPFLIELIDVDDAEISLVAREDGEPNWAFDVDRAKQRTAAKGGDFAVLLRHVEIEAAHIVLESPARDRPLDIELDFLAQEHRADDFLHWQLRATLNDRPMTLDGKAGTWGALLAGKDIRYDVAGQLDTFEIRSEGWIDDVAALRRPSLTFDAKGPDIDDLSRLLGVGDEGVGDIDLSGSLTPQDGGPLVLSVEGNIGQTQIKAAGAFSDLQQLSEMDFDLSASGPSLGRVLSLAGVHRVPEAPFTIKVDAERQGPAFVVNEARMMFGEAQFESAARLPNFPSLEDGRIELKVAGPHLERFRDLTRLPGEIAGAFSLSAELDSAPGGTERLRLDLKTSVAKVVADGRLGDAPDYLGSQMRFDLASDSLARLGNALGVADLPDRPLKLGGELELTDAGIETRKAIEATVGEVTAIADGLITLEGGLLGTDIDFGLSGPDLAALVGAFGGSAGVPGEPYDIDGQLQIVDDGYRLRNVSGTLGTSAVSADGLLVPGDGLAGSRFSFRAGGPALEEIVDHLGELKVRPGAFELSGAVSLQPGVIRLRNVELERARGKLWLDLGLALPVSRRSADFDLRARGPDIRAFLGGVGHFTVEEAPFSIDARGRLRATRLSFDKLNVGVGEARADAHGHLELAGSGAAAEFQFNGDIPSLSRLGAFNGRRLSEQGMGWHANIVSGGGVVRADELHARLGDSDIRGSVHYRTGAVPRLDVDLYSDAIVLAPLLEQAAFEYDAEPDFLDGKLIPDAAIPLDAMAGLNATLDLDIRALQYDALRLTDIDLQVSLQDGVLELRDAGFKARSGYLRSRARFDPAAGVGSASLELIARDFALGLAETNSDLAFSGDVNVALVSAGNDLRALAGNASGVVFIHTRGGRIGRNRYVQALYGDLLNEIVNTVNPFHESDPYTDFECIVIPAMITDGRLVSRPSALIRTSRVQVAMKSAIDLKTEEIDVSIRTAPRQTLAVSAGELLNPFVQVTGTLAGPRLAVDEQGVLITGGVAVATGGLSLLARGLWDRLSRARDPCGESASAGIEALGDRFPDLAAAPAE